MLEKVPDDSKKCKSKSRKQKGDGELNDVSNELTSRKSKSKIKKRKANDEQVPSDNKADGVSSQPSECERSQKKKKLNGLSPTENRVVGDVQTQQISKPININEPDVTENVHCKKKRKRKRKKKVNQHLLIEPQTAVDIIKDKELAEENTSSVTQHIYFSEDDKSSNNVTKVCPSSDKDLDSDTRVTPTFHLTKQATRNKDYSTLPTLKGIPRCGDTLAFKVRYSTFLYLKPEASIIAFVSY